jgi:predicted PurR-regulated permease PerM
LVSILHKVRVPRPVAVVSVAISAFAAIFIFGAVVASQLGTLAQNIPVYQNNLEAKVKVIQDANVGSGIFDRISRLLDRLSRQIQAGDESNSVVAPGAEKPSAAPIPVEVVEPAPAPLQVLQTVIGPLIGPLATGGIIIVVVIFMLMKREDLRDRFIRLVGADDLHRTTAALQDAGKRIARYLLMQLVVNAAYALPIGIGLWIIGIPNAPLWGLMALILRFVPYIGPIIASIFPLALALAVDPGWTMVLWTVALFVALELVINMLWSRGFTVHAPGCLRWP